MAHRGLARKTSTFCWKETLGKQGLSGSVFWLPCQATLSCLATHFPRPLASVDTALGRRVLRLPQITESFSEEAFFVQTVLPSLCIGTERHSRTHACTHIYTHTQTDMHTYTQIQIQDIHSLYTKMHTYTCTLTYKHATYTHAHYSALRS